MATLLRPIEISLEELQEFGFLIQNELERLRKRQNRVSDTGKKFVQSDIDRLQMMQMSLTQRLINAQKELPTDTRYVPNSKR